MAIDLKTLSKPSGQRPIICTLFGEGGMGKTTLAAMFPNPVFIRTEDGTASLAGNDNVSLFPLATSTQDVLDAIVVMDGEDWRSTKLRLERKLNRWRDHPDLEFANEPQHR